MNNFIFKLILSLVLDGSSPSVRFSKSCLKNVFSVILLFIYLVLMAVAIFLAYQTIADFREKLKHPVMSVSFKEVHSYDAPGKTRGWTAYFLGNQIASAVIPGIKNCRYCYSS